MKSSNRFSKRPEVSHFSSIITLTPNACFFSETSIRPALPLSRIKQRAQQPKIIGAKDEKKEDLKPINYGIEFDGNSVRTRLSAAYPQEIHTAEFKPRELSEEFFIASVTGSLKHANIPCQYKNRSGIHYAEEYIETFSSPRQDYFQLKSFTNPHYWDVTASQHFFRAHSHIAPSQALGAFFAGPTFADCASAMQACIYRAIEEMIGTSEFNRIFHKKLTPFLITEDLYHSMNELRISEGGPRLGNPLRFLFDKRTEDLAEEKIKPGDIIDIRGVKEYDKKHFTGTSSGWNVICVGKNGEGKNLYLGFGPGIFSKPLTYDEIRIILIEHYNENPSNVSKKTIEFLSRGTLEQKKKAHAAAKLEYHKVDKDADIVGIQAVLQFNLEKLKEFITKKSLAWYDLPQDEEKTLQNTSDEKINEISKISVETRGKSFADYAPQTEEQKQMLMLAKKLAHNVISGKNEFRGLVFSGTPGVGKTHLSIAASRAVTAAGKKVCYVDATFCDNFYQKTCEEAGGKMLPIDFMQDKFREWLKSPDLIILDDINSQFGIGGAFLEVAINFAIFSRKAIILTSNNPVSYLHRKMKMYLSYNSHESDNLFIFENIKGSSYRTAWWQKKEIAHSAEKIATNDDALELLANADPDCPAGVILQTDDFDLQSIQKKFESILPDKANRIRLVREPYKNHQVHDMYFHDSDEHDVFIIKVTDYFEGEQLMHLLEKVHDSGKKVIVLTSSTALFQTILSQQLATVTYENKADRLRDRARNLFLTSSDWENVTLKQSRKVGSLSLG